MSVRRRSNETAVQAKAADKALALFVEDKLQAEASLIQRSATKALVAELTLLYVVTRNRFLPGHIFKMRQSCRELQATSMERRRGASERGGCFDECGAITAASSQERGRRLRDPHSFHSFSQFHIPDWTDGGSGNSS